MEQTISAGFESDRKERYASFFHVQVPGIASSFENALRFTSWALSLQGDPTWQQIASRWDVSRATAYRWLAAWRAARGAVA